MDSDIYAIAIGFSAIIATWVDNLLLSNPSPKTKATLIPSLNSYFRKRAI